MTRWFKLYRPIRRRMAGALWYLFGRDVSETRKRTRRLAVEIWQHLDDEPQQMVDWFVTALRETYAMKPVAVWIYRSAAPVAVRSGDLASFQGDQVQGLHRALQSHSFVTLDGRGDGGPDAIGLLRQMNAAFAVRLDQAGFSGLLVIGARRRTRNYGEEELNAVLLLVELLGATLHSHYLQDKRLQAERLAAQHEKMSALGLLTSCLAHEIKNPLSSIKTIATVLNEQFGPGHPHTEDVGLILSEVDRLSATAGQFLKFARPVESVEGSTSIVTVIDAAAQVLRGLAKGKDVAIETQFESGLPEIAVAENTMREIVFNLMLNAIEAAPQRGRVRVSVCRDDGYVVMVVRDNGPGITVELRERMFAPFVTDKPSGTGLGLFIVRRHVEQLGGQISCDKKPSEDTCFTVTLPMSATPPQPVG